MTFLSSIRILALLPLAWVTAAAAAVPAALPNAEGDGPDTVVMCAPA